MSLIKKINDPNGKQYDDFSIGSLVLDTEPIPGSFNTITSDAVAKIAGGVAELDAIVPEGASEENKLATAADVAGVQENVDTIEGKIPSDTSTTNKLVNESGLQDAIDNASESWSTGFTPKGESSVSDLNDLTTQSNGDSYIVTDSGTLTDGSLAVVAGDQVAWDATNSVWYKLPQYALKQFGTDEIHNLSQEATSFASGDFIAVSNTTIGARKMSKDTLLELTAQNARDNIVPALKNSDSNDKLKLNSDVVEKLLYEIKGISLTPSATYSGKAMLTDGTFADAASYTAKEYSVNDDYALFVTGRSASNPKYCLAVALDSNDNVLGLFKVGANTNYTDFVFILPKFTTKVVVNGAPSSPFNTDADAKPMTISVKAIFGEAISKVFDPTRMSSNAYKVNEIVFKDGELYKFKNTHYGHWSSGDVDKINLVDYLFTYFAKTKVNDLTKLQDCVFNLVTNVAKGDSVVESSTYSGKAMLTDGTFTDAASYTAKEYSVNDDYALFVSGRSANNPLYCLAVALDSNDNVIGLLKVGTGMNYTDELFVLPYGTAKVIVNGSPSPYNAPATSKTATILTHDSSNSKVASFEQTYSSSIRAAQTWNYSFASGSYYKVVLKPDSNDLSLLSYMAVSVKKGSINTFFNYSDLKYKRDSLELVFLASEGMSAVGFTTIYSEASSGSVSVELWQLDKSSKEVHDYNNIRPVIFDTDYSWDIDDTFATRILSWGLSTGKIDLVGVVLSEKNSISVPSMDGLLCEEGIGPAGIGLTTDSHGFQFSYHTLFKDFPYHNMTSNNDARTTEYFYRRALQRVPEGNKCDLIITGPLNNLSKLMSLEATETEISGMDLLRTRVRRVWIMGGSRLPNYSDYNFMTYPNATYDVLENCPVPLYIQDHEVATEPSRIVEGENLAAELGNGDYLAQAYTSWLTDSGSAVSTAYDPLTMLAAIEDNDYLSGFHYLRGHITYDVDTKTCSFTESSDGNHFVARKNFSSYLGYYKHRLDNIYFKKNFGPYKPNLFRIVP